MYMGWPVLRRMRTTVRSVCGQLCGAPSDEEGPILGAHQRTHFAAAGEKGEIGVACRCPHQRPLTGKYLESGPSPAHSAHPNHMKRNFGPKVPPWTPRLGGRAWGSLADGGEWRPVLVLRRSTTELDGEMQVHIFRAEGRIFAVTENGQGENLPTKYGSWAHFKAVDMYKGVPMPGVNVDECLDDIARFGISHHRRSRAHHGANALSSARPGIRCGRTTCKAAARLAFFRRRTRG